jgi:hypothetical protein
MTVAVASRKILFPSISGSTGPFSFTFPIIIRDGVPQIKVTKYSASGSPTVLSHLSGYTFSASGGGLTGGTATLNVAGATGEYLLISGLTPRDQPIKYSNQGKFFPEVHELSYDQLTLIALEQQDGLDGAVKQDPSILTAAPTIADFSTSDGKAPQYNLATNQFVPGPDSSQIAAAEGYATTAQAAAASAAADAAAAAAAAVGMKYRSVRAASTANIASLSGAQTVDAVSLVAGERVLLKNQSTASQNGIYVVAAGAWSRSTDMDAWTEVPGTVVIVTEGTANSDKAFLCTANDGGTIGVTAITFVDWASVIFDGTITAAKLASDAVTTAKILDANVTTAKIADGNVTPAKLASGTLPAGVGYLATSGSLGTVSSGTVTPLATTNGNFNHYTNNGAHTLAPPAGVCSMVVEVLNSASAGAITTSSFTKVTGDSLTTTNGHKFHLFITKSQNYSLLNVVALQ